MRSLTIRDYAIIDALELEFGAGFTVLTGETGAGKSIIVDALGLVLGDRADASSVRHGAERADITATFNPDKAACEWLSANDFDTGEECILRRVVGADGRSRGYIDGRPATLGQLRELGELLVDIHGQHEHQSLLRRDAQLALVDAHGDHDDLVHTIADVFDQWTRVDEDWRALEAAASDRVQRLDLLRFQVRELEALGLLEGELDGLEEEHARFANAGRLVEAAGVALAALDGDDDSPARSRLHHAVGSLAEVAALDRSLHDIHALLEQASVQVSEGADDLRRWLDRFDLDPARKVLVENRIGSAHQLARKHRVEPAELPGLLERLRSELDALDRSDERLAALATERDALARRYRETSLSLSTTRKATATALAEKVSERMQGLGMEGGKVAIEVTHDADRFARRGGDSVELLVSTNAGQPLRPLAKTASGGELSRIALAIQVVAAHAASMDCLIFDEVDAGVGGAVADIVGQALATLADARQVLCVTHLPQVAARGHHHLLVSKMTIEGRTRTGIRLLGDRERVEEIARMLGGVTVTDKVRATAREMLKAAQPRQAGQMP